MRRRASHGPRDDQTREARLDVGFDIAEVAQKSFIDVPLANLEAMPVAFVLGASLHDPLPSLSPTGRRPTSGVMTTATGGD